MISELLLHGGENMKAHSPPPCLASWVMESETPLQCATKELEYVQQHLNKLSCIFDQLENTTVDSDVSSKVILHVLLIFSLPFFYSQANFFFQLNYYFRGVYFPPSYIYFFGHQFFVKFSYFVKDIFINWRNSRCRKRTVCLQV